MSDRNDTYVHPPACRHCDEPLKPDSLGDCWLHAHGLQRCQQKVAYGHNAAHPEIPCKPGGGNPCRCTYAPTEKGAT